MKKLQEFLSKIINLNEAAFLDKVLMKPEITTFILEANKGQLWDGVDRNLDSLGFYSQSTISIKQRKGQPTDRVTLKDTGSFYDSFKVRITPTRIEIEADTITPDGSDLRLRYGVDIIGLSLENTDELVRLVRAHILIELRLHLGI